MNRPDYPQFFLSRREPVLRKESRWIPRLYRMAFERTSEIELLAELWYPGIFDRLEQIRKHLGRPWPDWCWMPTGEIAEVLAREYWMDTRTSNSVLGEAPQETEIRMDAARLAAVGAWRHAGRHVVTFVPSLVAAFHEWPDQLPKDLVSRWPAACIYIAFERTRHRGEDEGSGGVFLHLDWDRIECRAELRLTLDIDPAKEMAFAGLSERTLHLTGATLSGAVAATLTAAVMNDRSKRGDPTILDISPGSLFSAAVRHAASEARVWVAAAHYLGQARLDDAAGLLGLASPAAWPPVQRRGGRWPMLWIATANSQDRSAQERSGEYRQVPPAD